MELVVNLFQKIQIFRSVTLVVGWEAPDLLKIIRPSFHGTLYPATLRHSQGHVDLQQRRCQISKPWKIYFIFVFKFFCYISILSWLLPKMTYQSIPTQKINSDTWVVKCKYLSFLENIYLRHGVYWWIIERGRNSWCVEKCIKHNNMYKM